MVDFVRKSITKTAVRNLTAPIANEAAFAAIPAPVISTSPPEAPTWPPSSGLDP